LLFICFYRFFYDLSNINQNKKFAFVVIVEYSIEKECDFMLAEERQKQIMQDLYESQSVKISDLI